MKFGKLKLVLLFSNGQKLTIKCKSYSITKLTGTKGERELRIEGADRNWSVDLDEIVALTSRWCLF